MSDSRLLYCWCYWCFREPGIARAVDAISFSIVIGFSLHLIFRKEEEAKAAAQMMMPESEEKRNLWQNALCFSSMVGILVFANWINLSY